MTNVSVNSARTPASHRLLLGLALSAALLSFLLLGTANNRVVTPPAGRELIVPQTDMFASPFMLDRHVMSLLRELESRQEADFFNLRAALLSQPRFDVQETDEEVAVKVDVPQSVPLEEIQVEIRDGSVLHIQGGHQDKHSRVAFEKTYTLGRHVDAGAITATLSKDGVLTVTAPKVAKKEEEVRKIDVIKTEL